MKRTLIDEILIITDHTERSSREIFNELDAMGSIRNIKAVSRVLKQLVGCGVLESRSVPIETGGRGYLYRVRGED